MGSERLFSARANAPSVPAHLSAPGAMDKRPPNGAFFAEGGPRPTNDARPIWEEDSDLRALKRAVASIPPPSERSDESRKDVITKLSTDALRHREITHTHK